MSANTAIASNAPRFDVLNNLPEFVDQNNLISTFEKIRSGDNQARNQFISINLKLVRRVANRFMGRGVELDDLFSVGVLGLSHAIKKFDENRGIRFSTYAVPWITDSMRQYVAKNNHSVHVPVHITKASNKCKKTYYTLLNRLKREPTHQEIATEAEFGIESISKLLMMSSIEVSGSSSIGSDEDSSTSLMDTIASESVSPDSDLEKIDMGKDMINLALKMDYKLSTIIIHRFGLGGNEPKTLSQVGDMLGLTRERIRQLEQTALMAMKCMLEREGLGLSDLISK